MFSDVQRQNVKLVTRNLQIIVGALAAGVVVFLGVVLVLVDRGAPVARLEVPVLTYTGVIFASVGIVVWAIVPSFIARRMRQSTLDGKPPQLAAKLPHAAELGDVAALTAIYQTRTIISAALLEGLAFLNVVAYQLERQTISLAVAGVLLLMLVSQFPTVSRVLGWVEHQLAELKQLRHLER